MMLSTSAHGPVRAVILPTALILFLLAAMVWGVLDFSTSKTDEIAVRRQAQRVQIAIEQSLKSVKVDQEASTLWDDAVVRTRQKPLDRDWIDDNLGTWFHTYYHIDEVYLLDPRDRPIYAMVGGDRAPLRSFARISGPALDLARQLRARLVIARSLAPGAAERTVGVSEMAIVDGRPAFVSLKPILSESGKIAQPRGSEYVHVAVRYLDGNFLTGMAGVYSIDGARFSWTRVTPALPILAADGHELGYISWKPFQPGRQVEDKMVPVLCMTMLVVAALIGLLLLRIQRSRTDIEASRAHAEHLAFHDSLTGLPNRALFEDRLKSALARRDPHVAVLMLDMDRFKNVNDTLGHQAGDELIREFGRRLRSLVRAGDTIARLGGDEFSILIESACLGDVEQLAERILDVVKPPFEIMGSQVYVSASIGIAVAAGPDNDPLELVRKADIALYRVKEGGRNSYRLFSPEMDDSVKLRRTVEDELRQAIASGRGLILHYQPQVAREGTVIGLEALLRWEHPVRGVIAPREFVPVAEETGLMVPLGDWVLHKACLASRRWPGLFVSVNLSPVQFHAPGFVERLMKIVRETGANPSTIQLEVTERVLLKDDHSIRTILAKLRSAGFKIVLDDFGTGYSSLSYLRRFAVDKIKIDGSFVQGIEDSADSRAIVAAVLALGWALGLTVAAEGIETAEQCTFLDSAGCKEMQGHYFSPAVPVDDIAPLLAAPHRASAAA